MVKGVAAFDPFIMFKRPLYVVLRHFDILYSTLSLCVCVTGANESLCRDQYMQLLDHLRTAYGPSFDITSVSKGWSSSKIAHVCFTFSNYAAYVPLPSAQLISTIPLEMLTQPIVKIDSLTSYCPIRAIWPMCGIQ